MSLVCALDVNRIGTGVGIITIQRLNGTDDPPSVNRYRYEIYGDAGALVATGEVYHWSGDGAIGLLRHVLADSDDKHTCKTCGEERDGQVIDGQWICDRCRYLAAQWAMRTGWVPTPRPPRRARLTVIDNTGDPQ